MPIWREQRIHGDVVVSDKLPHLFSRPLNEGIHLQDRVCHGCDDFRLRELPSRFGLVPAEPRNPDIQRF